MAEQRRTERNRGWRAACAASLLLLVACSDGDDRAASQTTETTSGSNAESDAGTIEDTVTTSPELVVEPVAIGEVGAFGDGVTTRVTNVEAVEAEAFMPGEMSGPALAVTIEISNGTAAPVELRRVLNPASERAPLRPCSGLRARSSPLSCSPRASKIASRPAGVVQTTT